MQNKISWESLPAAHREAWVRRVVNFYPPNTITPHEAVELAREEYADADSELPKTEVCETE